MTILGGPRAPAANQHGWVSGAIAQDRRTNFRFTVAAVVIIATFGFATQIISGSIVWMVPVVVGGGIRLYRDRRQRRALLLHRSLRRYGPIGEVTAALDADMASGFADHGPVLISSTWVLVRAQLHWRAIRRDDLMGAELEQGGRNLRIRSAAKPPVRVRLPSHPQAARVHSVMKMTLEQNRLVGWGPRPTVAWNASPAGGPVGWVPVSPLLAGVAPNPFSVPRSASGWVPVQRGYVVEVLSATDQRRRKRRLVVIVVASGVLVSGLLTVVGSISLRDP